MSVIIATKVKPPLLSVFSNRFQWFEGSSFGLEFESYGLKVGERRG